MTDNRFSGENKRQHYRIVYPISCRPSLKITRKEFEVVDISESGIRFLNKKWAPFTPGVRIQAEITFNDGDTLEIDGEILRVDDQVSILKLHNSIPFWKIVEEQRYIKKNYPDYLL
ncbi:MAG: PilZ domain-containing protein [Nitrospirota bacterium]|nr:PilZ domain-containing protein [Nitrospirota bacterium]